MRMPHSLFLPPPPSPMALPPPFPPSANLVKLSPDFCPPKCISLPVCPTVSVSVFACLRLDLTFQPETIVLSLSCVHVVFVSVLCKRHHFDGDPLKTIKCICQPSIAVCLTQISSIPRINYLRNRNEGKMNGSFGNSHCSLPHSSFLKV